MRRIEKYLNEKDGTPSSTRLFAWKTLQFFFWFNILILIAYFGFGILSILKGVEYKFFVSETLILGIDFLLVIAIFAPKALNKIQEVRETINGLKGGLK